MFEEYPKVIRVGGVSVTVLDAADEARWRTPPPAPEPLPDLEPVVTEALSHSPAPVKTPAQKKPAVKHTTTLKHK